MRFNPYRLFVGSFIPNCLMEYTELSSSAKLLWARLAQHAGQDGYCWPKQETLAKEVGLSTDRIKRLLAELEDEGFIEVERPTGADRLNHIPNKYFFLQHPIFHPSYNTSGGGENNTPASGENNTPLYSKEKVQIEKVKEPVTKETEKPRVSRRTIPAGTIPLLSPLENNLPCHFAESKDFLAKWNEFKEYRKQIKAPIKTSNVLSHLLKLSNNSIPIAIAILQRSLDNEWRGLFAPEKGDRYAANRDGDKAQFGKYSNLKHTSIDND